MTEEDRAIVELMTVPPKIVLTPKERRQRLIMRIFGLVSILSFLVASSALIVDASSSCVNNVLQARNGPSNTDAKAHITFAESLLSVLTAPPVTSPAASTAVRVALTAEVQQYVNDLKADQAFRNAHPLGHC